MSTVVDIMEFAKASSGSVIRMLPVPDDTHPFYADYDLVTVAVDALASRSPLHISGQSGTGKSHFLNSLLYGPQENITRVIEELDLPRWPSIKVHRLFVSSFETPSEVWYRTEVVNFSTEDRPQRILEVLAEAAADSGALHIVWLVESGRGISETVQGAFLEIVGQAMIREPRGQTFQAANITFVTDSNHAANESGEFSIWDLDQAYGRRWTRRMTFRGLTPEQEATVLRELAPDATGQQIQQVVTLAMGIRQKHSEGALQSVLPPTIDAELDLLGCMRRLPVGTRHLVFSTLLGHCATRDRDEAETVFAEAFGIRIKASTPAAEAVGVL
jgi:MoxR-like ATPase